MRRILRAGRRVCDIACSVVGQLRDERDARALNELTHAYGKNVYFGAIMKDPGDRANKLLSSMSFNEDISPGEILARYVTYRRYEEEKVGDFGEAKKRSELRQQIEKNRLYKKLTAD